MFSMNIFSPYEAAKRLGFESKSLMKTGERYLQYLTRLKKLDDDYEKEVVSNYEQEYKKVEVYKKRMIQVIEEYSSSVQKKLLQKMVQQRTIVGEHVKEIRTKSKEIDSIIKGVNAVEKNLQLIQDNEEAYLHKQMQQYYH